MLYIHYVKTMLMAPDRNILTMGHRKLKKNSVQYIYEKTHDSSSNGPSNVFPMDKLLSGVN